MIKVKHRHEKKLVNLHYHKRKLYGESNTLFIRSTVHNYSSYNLSIEEGKALWFGLDQHTPTTLTHNNIDPEFQYFYQNISNDILHLSEDDFIKLKTKLHYSCEKYSDIKVSYKYQRYIYTLRRNNSIVVLKQDKGREVGISIRISTLRNVCLYCTLISLCILDKNRKISHESKIQRTLRKIKSKLSTEEYRKIYPTGFNADRIYGTAKVHKIDRNNKVDKLPLHLIVSNVGTASYQLAKYPAKLLSPLSKSEYTVQSSTEFTEYVKPKAVPRGYHLVSLDVISLLMNVPLDATIDIVLKRIYDNREINKTINKREMKDLIKFCTKDIHFNFNWTIYVQKDGAAMGSPLASVLAVIFMVEFERAVVPKLSQHLQFWKSYVDDTICFVCNEYQEFVLSCLNSFHNCIQLTNKIEKEN